MKLHFCTNCGALVTESVESDSTVLQDHLRVPEACYNCNAPTAEHTVTGEFDILAVNRIMTPTGEEF